MIFKFYLHFVLFFCFGSLQTAFISQYEGQLLLRCFANDIQRVVRFLFSNASESESQFNDEAIVVEKRSMGQNIPSEQYIEEGLLKKMKKDFINRVRFDEQLLLDDNFEREYRDYYDLYYKKIFEFRDYSIVNEDLLSAILSIKFDAIIKTLFFIVKNQEKSEDFGVFNDIFYIIRENNFIIDEEIFEPLLNKIIKTMQYEQMKIYCFNKNKQEGFLSNFIAIFVNTYDKNCNESNEDNFEKIFIKYGLTSDHSREWDKLFDACRYDFHLRRMEEIGRQAAYSME